MNKKKKLIILPLLILLTFAPLFSQETEPAALLVYADDETALEVRDSLGESLESYLGMEIPPGSSIITGATTAELQLEPTGSIIKMANNTIISLDNLQKTTEESNDITVSKGKLRAVIAHIIGRQDRYNFFTGNAVCGIRGTDFVLDSTGLLAVAEGAVDFTKQSSKETLRVSRGMMADGAAEIFAMKALNPSELSRAFESLQFTYLKPETVPGHKAEEPEPTMSKEEKPAEDPALEEPRDIAEEENDPLMAILGGVLAMEVGSFTVDGITYSKLLFQPTFQVGKLQASLYLPFIYDQNLFNPDDWYKPEGNNEWSFGSDQDKTADVIADAFGDLFLKIRYLKWGQQRDSFYFAFGNYSQVNLGHGILMLNYNNNSEFPAVRKVGLNLGFYGKAMDFEMVGEDFSRPLEQVAGGRVALPIIGPLSLGLSSVVDMDPAQNMNPDVDQSYIDRDPLFVNFALDLDFPIIERSLLSSVLYADAASMVPVTDGAAQWDYLYEEEAEQGKQLRNYGASLGMMGRLFIINYQLEYQYADSIFRHGFYNSTYDKLRGDHVKDVLDFLDSPETLDPRQGIYGQAGFDIAQIIYFTAGYNWTWTKDGPNPDDDYLALKLTLYPDVIPVVGLYGSLSYSRTGFAGAIEDSNLQFIDSNTILRGEVVYPASTYLDIALVLASAMERNVRGDLLFDSSGNPLPTYSVTLDVRLHY